MPEFHAQELEEWSGGRWERQPDVSVRGFAFDSRKVQPGDLFVCLKTERRDGHDFMADAAAAGAVGAVVSAARPGVDLPQLVVEEPMQALRKMAAQHRRRFTGPVIGVTGSCGKTSTKDLLKSLLGNGSRVHATEGNFNNLLGVSLTLLKIDPACHQMAVVEAGINEPGEMTLLAEMIQPSHAIVTLVAPAHLEKLIDLDGVAREKSALLRAVPHSGAVLFPASCLLFESFHDFEALAITVDAEGRGSDPDVVYRLEQLPESTMLQTRSGERDGIFTLRKVSAGMVANAALAIEMARVLDVPDSAIQERLFHWSPACNRGEVVEHGSTRFFVDCYNANPAAMEDSLEFFDELARNASCRLYVLGCMGELGEDSACYHRDLGRRIKLREGDRIFITGGDEVLALREGLLAAGNDPARIRVFQRIEEIEHDVITSRGFVFVKGSRVYALETLVGRAAAQARRVG